MKHAVILAHPKASSLNASIAGACVRTLEGLGHSVLVRDLYAIGFDPRLQAGEIPADTGFAPAPDVLAERAALADVDSFIFVYPFWFNAPPAMLKGYVDRIFGMGFGYAPGSKPLLGGRTLFSISTSGAPDHWVNSTGALRSLMEVFDFHLGGVCGLKPIDHVHFGGVVSNLTEEAAEDMLSQVHARLGVAFLASTVGVDVTAPPGAPASLRNWLTEKADVERAANGAAERLEGLVRKVVAYPQQEG